MNSDLDQRLRAALQRGMGSYRIGQFEQADADYCAALALDPRYVPALYQRGLVLTQMRRFDEAIANFDAALAVDPRHVDAHDDRASALWMSDRLPDALAGYDQALAVDARHKSALINRGGLLHAMARYDDALTAHNQALVAWPDQVTALYNRANTLQAMGRWDDALAAFSRILQLRADHMEAANNMGVLLQLMNRPEDALAAFDRAVRLKPNYVRAHINRASALHRLGRYAEAAESYKHVLQIDPSHPFVKGQLAYTLANCCAWDGLDALRHAIDEDIAAGKQVAEPFGYQGFAVSESLQRRCAETYTAAKYPARPLGFAAPAPAAKIRIGYLSGEFRDQATAVLMAGVFEAHDKSRFEITAFDNGWDDGSPLRARLVKAFDHIVDISRMNDAEAAALIHRRGIDILVNLNGYFGSGRPKVFSHRPAPVQVNYLGFPGTLGAAYMDYILADKTVIPENAQHHYIEAVAYLPHCYQANDRARPISAQVFTRAELGLPAEGFVFCSFNNPYKILPSTFDSWMRILKNADGSVLWLLEGSAEATANLRKEAEARGVAAERLIFAPRLGNADHLARHRAADLFLDTLPCNAHTTASDALWTGLPLLTQVGATFSGRVAASLLKAIGLQELIATSAEEYEALAADLAHHPEKLAALRRRLADNRLTTPLYDTAKFTNHIEDAFRQMHERHAAGLAPASLRVPG